MISVWESFETALSAGSPLALLLALLGGLVMGLNPCCLTFYPAVAATCCASATAEKSVLVVKGAGHATSSR